VAVRLQILNGKREGETIEIAEPGVHQVGTARAAKIQLRDKDVAFKHANFILEGEDLWVEDLGSPKGVFIGADRLAENTKQKLKNGDKVVLGTTEMQVAFGPAAAAAAPAPAPKAAPPPPPPEPEPEPEPAPPPPSPAAAKPAKGAVDADALLAELKDMKSRLSMRDKEVKELSAALDAAATGAVGGADTGLYGDTAARELEATILELRQQNDAQTAGLLEKDELIGNLRKDLDQQKREYEGKLADERKKRGAVEREIQRKLEEKESDKGERKGLQTDLDDIRTANEKLVLENDELKDKVDGLTYRIEQEAARRGEMVRQRISEVQAENKRLEESNAELRTLVEAYEEKIDELDEKVEELEGEHEEVEKQLDETRDELSKAKAAKDAVEKTMRQRIQRLEERNEEVEAEIQRLRTAVPTGGGEGGGGGGGGGDAGEAAKRIAFFEKLLDDAEVMAESKRAAAKLPALEAEVQALKKKLEGAGASLEGAEAEQKLLELEKVNKDDAKKIERLERKNKELVRANVQSEMARQEAERRLSELGEAAKKS
jgi:DNA repair exonuclease SbcCD ATPase subunit